MIELDKMRYAEYTVMPDIMGPIATGVGLELSQDALLIQSTVAGMVATLDDTIDRGSQEEQETALSYLGAIARGVPAVEPKDVLLPQLITDIQVLQEWIPPRQFALIYDLGRRAIKLSTEYTNEPDIRRYHSLRLGEAALAFEILARSIPESEQASPLFSQYVKHMRIAGAIAGALDSVKDLREDAKASRTVIPPTIRSHTTLTRMALHEVVSGVREIGLRTTARIFGETLKYGLKIEKLHYLRGIRHPK